MATQSSVHAWEMPWTEEPGGLQSMESQKSDMTECMLTLCNDTYVFIPISDLFQLILSFFLFSFSFLWFDGFILCSCSLKFF